MPNWCSLIITVSGSIENMAKFYSDIGSDEGKHELSFEKTVNSCFPLLDEDNTKRWGTKWDLIWNSYHDYTILKDEPEIYMLECETAWSPPINWAHRAGNKYDVTIQIAYVEIGMGYYGIFKYIKDKTKDTCYKVIDGDQVDAIDENGDEDFVISGRLKDFMNKYNLKNIGG